MFCLKIFRSSRRPRSQTPCEELSGFVMRERLPFILPDFVLRKTNHPLDRINKKIFTDMMMFATHPSLGDVLVHLVQPITEPNLTRSHIEIFTAASGTIVLPSSSTYTNANRPSDFLRPKYCNRILS